MDDFSTDTVKNDTDIENNNICFNVNECPTSISNENIVRFYYLDAFEDFAKHPGFLLFLNNCVKNV